MHEAGAGTRMVAHNALATDSRTTPQRGTEEYKYHSRRRCGGDDDRNEFTTKMLEVDENNNNRTQITGTILLTSYISCVSFLISRMVRIIFGIRSV